MIPANLYDPRRAQGLLDYLIQEIRRTRGDRSKLEQRWTDWQTAYRARPIEEVKTWPFEGAANLVIPVIATDVDTLFARLMSILMEPENLWSVQASRPELADVAPRIQEFLQWVQHNEMENLPAALSDWILELHKIGTGVLKQRWHRETKKVFEWRELGMGTWQQQAIILLKDAAEIRHVRLHNFYVPAGFPELQEAPWCAERISMTWQQFTNRVNAGIYQGSDRVTQWYANSYGSNVQQAYDTISGYKPSLGRLLEPYEFWTNFDIDGDGYDEALVCSIHEESGTYLRLDFNPFFNQDYPYSVGRFMRDGNSFYGIGLCEMLDHAQEEATAIHNQRLDAGTIGNTQMYAVTKDNKNIAEDEPIWTGKIWKVNNINDIKPLIMGTTNEGQSIQNEQALYDIYRRRTGVSDYVTGQATPAVGYGAAYTTQQMIANSSKRFGQTLREINGALSESGTRTLELYQQFNQRGKEYMALGPLKGQLVRAVLQFPIDLIRRGFKVSVTAITAETTKDAQIRTNTIIQQQLMQFYMQYLQALQMLSNPMMKPFQPVILQMIDGMSTLMRRLLDLYGVQDSDRMIPELDTAINVYQQQFAQLEAALSGAGGMGQAGPAGNGFAPQPGAAPGMGAVPGSLNRVSQALSGQPAQGGLMGGGMPGAGGAGYPGGGYAPYPGALQSPAGARFAPEYVPQLAA